MGDVAERGDDETVLPIRWLCRRVGWRRTTERNHLDLVLVLSGGIETRQLRGVIRMDQESIGMRDRVPCHQNPVAAHFREVEPILRDSRVQPAAVHGAQNACEAGRKDVRSIRGNVTVEATQKDVVCDDDARPSKEELERTRMESAVSEAIEHLVVVADESICDVEILVPTTRTPGGAVPP